ncbi:MAG TPA: hypothetical protein VGO68_06450 [Pyrinomonadaceae bacterium]|nr:hypothetical protein [Pyrinomonadaceae bacterium]
MTHIRLLNDRSIELIDTETKPGTEGLVSVHIPDKRISGYDACCCVE